MECEFLDARDLAPKLGRTVTRVYQLMQAGEIPAVKIGGRLRVPVKAWDEWMAQKIAEAKR
jgi:excisionase family DNA binding protein